MKNLIILEGPDCGGKSTLGRFLADFYGGVYFNCIWSPKLSTGIWDYHWHVLDMAVHNINTRGQVWILDRSWPSEVIYSKIFRPEAHPDALIGAEECHRIITSVECLYVLCSDSGIMKRHQENKDEAHPYPDDKFEEVITAYNAWANGMHEDYISFYSLMASGHDLREWAESTIDN